MNDNDRTEISDGVVKSSPTKSQPQAAKDTQLTWPKNKPLQKKSFSPVSSIPRVKPILVYR
jgi:hypothetical protein